MIAAHSPPLIQYRGLRLLNPFRVDTHSAFHTQGSAAAQPWALLRYLFEVSDGPKNEALCELDERFHRQLFIAQAAIIALRILSSSSFSGCFAENAAIKSSFFASAMASSDEYDSGR